MTPGQAAGIGPDCSERQNVRITYSQGEYSVTATELRRIFSRTTVRAGLSRPGFRPGPSHSSIRSWSGAWIVSFAALFVLAFVPATASAAPQGPWQVPAINLSATGQNASSPQIAFPPDGTATAVWTRPNAANDSNPPGKTTYGNYVAAPTRQPTTCTSPAPHRTPPRRRARPRGIRPRAARRRWRRASSQS